MRGDAPPEGEGWRLRPYRAGDEREIVRRFEESFGRPQSEDVWRWKLKRRPAPTENVYLAVDDDDRPISQYAGIPCRLRVADGTVDVMVLVDLWTAPEYRRRGVMTRVATWVHERWRRAGVAAVLAAPNERWGSRARVLGWKHLVPLAWQIRPLRPERIAARRLRFPPLARARILGAAWNGLCDRGADVSRAIDVAPLDAAGFDELSASPLGPPAGKIGLVRDAAWLRWRYLDCPLHGYEVLAARRDGRVAGYLVHRLEALGDRRFGFIAELTARDEDPAVADALRAAAIERFRARDADAVATLAIPGTAAHAGWRRRGFVASWGRFQIQTRPLADDLPLDAMREPARWAMAGGDFDVV